MNEDLLDDGILDDLHEGVEALRTVSRSQSNPLSPAAVATIQRLEAAVPIARQQVRQWRQRIKEKALRAAKKTDAVAHEYPWIFTLTALGLGVLTGFLVAYTTTGGHGDDPSEDSED